MRAGFLVLWAVCRVVFLGVAFLGAFFACCVWAGFLACSWLCVGLAWVWVLFWGAAKAGKHKLVTTKAAIRVFVIDMMCSCG